jgi:hypothetical protein
MQEFTFLFNNYLKMLMWLSTPILGSVLVKKQKNPRLSLYWRVMLHNTIMSPFCPYKIDVALKSLLDQNPIVVYHKFNGDFKSHINFGGIQW